MSRYKTENVQNHREGPPAKGKGVRVDVALMEILSHELFGKRDGDIFHWETAEGSEDSDWKDDAADQQGEITFTEWEKLFQEAGQQMVFPIVYACVRDMKMFPGPGEYEGYEKFYGACIRRSMKNRQAHNALHRFLTDRKIPYVILKGQASSRYYPEPVLRYSGDVDFLIRKEQREEINELLLETGWERTHESDNHSFHWSYQKDKDYLEMHWDVPGIPEDNNFLIHQYLESVIDRALPVNDGFGELYLPSDFHHGLILLLHTLSHLTGGGIGLRHLFDWLVFENSLSEERFTGLFEEPLRRIGLWAFAKAFTEIGIRHLGCLKRNWCADADPDLCDALLKDILLGGDFGIKDETRRRQAKMIRSNQSMTIGGRNLIGTLLPNIHEKAVQKCGFIREKPFLAPLGWAYVSGEYLMDVIKGRTINVFDKKVMEDASERREIYSALKLFLPEEQES